MKSKVPGFVEGPTCVIIRILLPDFWPKIKYDLKHF